MPAAHQGAVHDVIVDEGEGVEDFQSGGGSQDLGTERVVEQAVDRQAQPRTQPLSADGYHIAERVVQSFRFAGEFKGGKQPAYGFFDFFLCNHGTKLRRNPYNSNAEPR